jgi:asparagine synthase (glutamine-hydrolysing)
MCGICGIIYPDGRLVNQARLKSANDLIHHRGPDDEGFHIERGVGLAMRRLSVIDLRTGHQPLSYAEESLWIVFNGEIYNFLELRKELEGKGYKFKTKTDTEVILALYQEMGDDCLSRLRGMFAFALWDKGKKRLLLARDRLGKKPMVYSEGPGFLAFASELRCLFALEDISREINPEAVDMFLSLQYIPSPRTIYAAAKKLSPAHKLVYENGKSRIEPYWDLPLNQPPRVVDVEEGKTLIREKLKESVKLRMISDVPIGAFLSGGIDSSIIVALMSELSPRPVKTFSIGFEEKEFSELPYARKIAEKYGCDHSEFIVSPKMAEILPKLAWHYGEPYADPSALPSYYVSQETRRFVTVALNGDGGDENFAGYIRYFAMKLGKVFDGIPQTAREALRLASERLPEYDAPYGFFWRLKRFFRSAVFNDLAERHLKMAGFFSAEDKAGLYSPDFLSRLGKSQGEAARYFADFFGRAKSENFTNQLLYVDFKTYLPECLMAKIDIASMANSLEARSPFLDHEFVETVFRLPGDWKLKGLRGHKWILKEAFRDKLPSDILSRKKMGFGIPLGSWFRGPLKEFWESHALSPQALARGYFERKTLERFWSEHQSGRRDHGYRLWALLMLELWHEECLDKPGG